MTHTMHRVGERMQFPAWPLMLLLVPAAMADPAPVGNESDEGVFDPASVDLVRLISCEALHTDYFELAMALQEPANIAAIGWHKIPQDNTYLSEYALSRPIIVFGHETSRIAFASSGILAVLDLPDPHPLASELGLKAAIDVPGKAMFAKERFRSKEALTSVTVTRTIALNVSNVTSHPGKTLAGCSYRIDVD